MAQVFGAGISGIDFGYSFIPHDVVPTNVGTHPEMGQPLRSERWRASEMGPGFRRGDRWKDWGITPHLVLR